MIRILFGIFITTLLISSADAKSKRTASQPIYSYDYEKGMVTANLEPLKSSIRRPSRGHTRKVVARQRQFHEALPAYVRGGLITIATAAGNITINSAIAEKMKGFIADAVDRGFSGRVHCHSATGHVYNSTHHSGGGCDFAQTGWNKTHRVMYKVTDLASKWGLRDGCSFRDCGHIDGGSRFNAPPAGHHRRYAHRHHRRHYATAH